MLRCKVITRSFFFGWRPKALLSSREPVLTTAVHHGRRRVDEFAHLQQWNPKTRQLIADENQRASSYLSHLKKKKVLSVVDATAVGPNPKKQINIYDQVLNELRMYASVQVDHEALPPKELRNGMWYEMDIHGRYFREAVISNGTAAQKELVFDPEWIEPRHSVGQPQLSRCGQFVAYLLRRSGDEAGSLIVRELSKGYPVIQRITDVMNYVWSKNSKGILYTVLNDQIRPYQVRLRWLGATSELPDPVLYTEADEGFFVDVSQTKDSAYLTINITSRSCSEVHVLSSDLTPTELPNLTCVQRRVPDLEYFVDHHDGHFYIVTNGLEPSRTRFQLAMAPASSPGLDHWKAVPNLPSDLLEDVDLFQTHAVMYTRDQETAEQKVWCYRWSDASCIQVPLPDKYGTVVAGVNPDWTSNRFRFIWHGLGVRERVLEYDFSTGALNVLRDVRVPGFDASEYMVERILLPETDGVRVPMTLAFHRSLRPRVSRLLEQPAEDNSQNKDLLPMLVTGYAAYGIPAEPPLDIHYLPLLQRHWLVAVVHARGGGDLGRKWYFQGRGALKKNSIQDFVHACHYLKHSVPSPTSLCAFGLSAGGLLVASSLLHPPVGLSQTQWMHQFRAVVLHVPFLDPVTAMMDETMPLTTTEYEEWGNPKDNVQDYDRLVSYAPYDRISTSSSLDRNKAPSFFLTAGMRDQRVAYWQPLKWTTRMRQKYPDVYSATSDCERDPVMLLVTREDGDHFADSSDSVPEDTAVWLSFLISESKKTK